MIINEGELAAQAIKTVAKLWGTEYWMTNTPHYCMKFLKVNPGYQSSIHAHRIKHESFIGAMGTLVVRFHHKNKKVKATFGVLQGGVELIIPAGQFHSFEATNVSWVIEVSTHHDDEDVIRVQESRKLP